MKHFKLLHKVLNFSAERYFKTAGDLFVYDENYESALTMVEKTLSLDPENLRALVLKADILFCLNRDLEALEILNIALRIDPACVEAIASKVGILDILDRCREALDVCNQALEMISNQNDFLVPSLLDQKVMLLIRLKKFRQAQQTLTEAAARLSPEEYHVLAMNHRPVIERFCKQRQRTRELRRLAHCPQASLQLISGEAAFPPAG